MEELERQMVADLGANRADHRALLEQGSSHRLGDVPRGGCKRSLRQKSLDFLKSRGDFQCLKHCLPANVAEQFGLHCSQWIAEQSRPNQTEPKVPSLG